MGKDIKKIFSKLEQDFNPWFSAYRELASYIDPTKGIFDDNINSPKLIDGKKILDSESARAVRIFASGMMSGLTSPSRKWFKLKIKGYENTRETDILKFLNYLEDEMYSIFDSSNIYGILTSIYEEIAIFGTASAMFLSDPFKIIKGRNFTAGEYFLGSSTSGVVDIFCRKYFLTVEQLINEFGIENVSSNVKQAYQNGEYNKPVKVNMMILKNDRYVEGSSLFKYNSYYWEDSSKEKEFLAVRGFKSYPIVSPRWEVSTSIDVYGKSPSWFALPDIKMLQKLQHDKLVAVDKVVNPPVVIDGSSQVTSLNLMPSGITRVSSLSPEGSVRPAYQIQPDLNALMITINETKQNIRSKYYVDLFLAITNIDKSNVTATEIAQRHEEKLLMLGPVYDRLKNELLNPLIERTFELMIENGRIKEFPEKLAGKEIKIEYISLLAQAQKMIGLSALERTTSFVASISPLNPAILDMFNIEEAVKSHAMMTGVDPNILRNEEEILRIRKEREDKQRMIEDLAVAESLSKTSANLSKAKMIGENLPSQTTGGIIE